MSIGIYCLKFKNTDKVYIGQSVNIEKRFQQHILSMHNNSAPKKLQFGFNIHGKPSLVILLECSSSELDAEEVDNINVFDSVNNGFNTYSDPFQAPSSNFGEDSGNSKFTNEQISKAFFMLIDSTYYTQEDISNKCGITKYVVASISAGCTHLWLSEVYPIEYAILLNKIGTRNTMLGASSIISEKLSAKYRGIKYPPILSPSGATFVVDNVCKFARENCLRPNHLTSVLNGKRKSHQGWKLCPQEP